MRYFSCGSVFGTAPVRFGYSCAGDGSFALLNPGDTMVSAVGSPYDTMQSVIGITGDAPGNLKKRGVRYKEVPLKGNAYDLDAIAAAVDENVKLVEIQRSRGYMLRDSLFPEDIKKLSIRSKQKS